MAQQIIVVPYGTTRDGSNVMGTDFHPGRIRERVNGYLVTANAAGWFAVHVRERESCTELLMERRSGDQDCPQPQA